MHGLLLAKLVTRIIILTGGIGCGKTAVAREFEALGLCVVDADAISHELTGPGGDAIVPIRAAFGVTVIGQDGGLDRAVMRERVFRDPESRQRLEAILHPLIYEKAKAALAQAQGPYAVYVVPLWIEKYGANGSQSASVGLKPDAIVVVDCPEEIQIERVMARSNLSQSQVQAIMLAQASRQERLSHADYVIENDGPEKALTDKVVALHKMLSKPSHHNE